MDDAIEEAIPRIYHTHASLCGHLLDDTEELRRATQSARQQMEESNQDTTITITTDAVLRVAKKREQDDWVDLHKEFATWITDPTDERAKPFSNLKDGNAEGFFIAEGTETVRTLLQQIAKKESSRYNTIIIQVISIFLKPSVFFDEPVHLRRDVLAAIQNNTAKMKSPVVPTFQLLLGHEKIMSQIAGFHIARGCLAYGMIPKYHQETVFTSARRIVALDGICDTANLGSVVRTASCLGMDAILLSGNSCDAWYRRAVRVSMGHCFRIPILRVSDLSQTLLSLQDHYQFVTYAALVSDESQRLDQIGVGTVGEKWCCVLGNEGNGISAQVREVCRRHVRIKMDSGVDSLSLPVAAGILLHGLLEKE